MSAGLFCMRCGHDGPGVSACLVDLEAEAKRDGERIRMVETVQEIEHKHITERVCQTVPERYGAEWRCKDQAACDARLDAQRLADEPQGVGDPHAEGALRTPSRGDAHTYNQPEPMTPAVPAPADEEGAPPWL